MILPYKQEEYKIDRLAFEQVVKDIEQHNMPLNLNMLGAIFGQPFWELLILCQLNTSIKLSEVNKVEIQIKDSNSS